MKDWLPIDKKNCKAWIFHLNLKRENQVETGNFIDKNKEEAKQVPFEF